MGQFHQRRAHSEGDEESKVEVEELKAQVKALRKALRRLIDELDLRRKVDKARYLRVNVNGRWLSLGPVAPLIKG